MYNKGCIFVWLRCAWQPILFLSCSSLFEFLCSHCVLFIITIRTRSTYSLLPFYSKNKRKAKKTTKKKTVDPFRYEKVSAARLKPNAVRAWRARAPRTALRSSHFTSDSRIYPIPLHSFDYDLNTRHLHYSLIAARSGTKSRHRICSPIAPWATRS